MINNFILVHYLEKKWEVPQWYSEETKKSWTEYIQKYRPLYLKLLKIMFRQIGYFYPNAHIHLLTNEQAFPDCKNPITVHYDSNLPNSHVAKLKIYGLLDCPAMFLDTDILLLRRFEVKHLECDGPFNIFRKNPPYEKLKRIEGLGNLQEVYNSGVVWIPGPNKQISADLFDIYKKYFSNHDYLDSLQIQFENDEHALANYIKINNLKMRVFEEVNKQRKEIIDSRDYQSVHYSGTQKMMLPGEYTKLFARIMHG